MAWYFRAFLFGFASDAPFKGRGPATGPATDCRLFSTDAGRDRSNSLAIGSPADTAIFCLTSCSFKALISSWAFLLDALGLEEPAASSEAKVACVRVGLEAIGFLIAAKHAWAIDIAEIEQKGRIDLP